MSEAQKTSLVVLTKEGRCRWYPRVIVNTREEAAAWIGRDVYSDETRPPLLYRIERTEDRT